MESCHRSRTSFWGHIENVYRCIWVQWYRAIWLQGHLQSFAGTASATISVEGYVPKPLLRLVIHSNPVIGIGVFVGTRRYRILTWYRGFGDHTEIAEVVQRRTAAFTKDSRYAPSRLHSVLHITFPARSSTFTLYFTKKDPSPLFPSQCQM